MDYQERIDSLLDQFEEQRNELKQMINEIETIKNKIDQLLPENINSDYRNFSRGAKYMSLFEERVKSMTDFFRLILDMRKEISRTLKEEIEIRRKSQSSDEGDIAEKLDVSRLAEQVENLNKKKDKFVEKKKELVDQ